MNMDFSSYKSKQKSNDKSFYLYMYRQGEEDSPHSGFYNIKFVSCLFYGYDTLWLFLKTLVHIFWQNMMISCVNPKSLTLTQLPLSKKL